MQSGSIIITAGRGLSRRNCSTIGARECCALTDRKTAEYGNLHEVHGEGERDGGDKRPDDRDERQRRHGDSRQGERRGDQNVDA